MNIKRKFSSAVLIALILVGCKQRATEDNLNSEPSAPKDYMEFQELSLNDLEFFQNSEGNWQIGGNAFADRKMDRNLVLKKGSGVLANLLQDDMKANLFTNLEHGDMELEIDVMMPKGSNSGLYFQGRYEIQLLDSWGVDEVKHGDMGGIYQRWNKDAEEGQNGYEGYAPALNAAKAPGLWQHLKIIFHAPRFDDSGNKLENARFEEVWLNGELIHKDQEVSGPTRAAAFTDEKPLGPLMLQGDHGPVAFKNIRYKLYEDKKLSLEDISMTEYENASVEIPDLDGLSPMQEVKTDSISSNMVTGRLTQRILKFTGMIDIPDSGEYLFDFAVNGTGGQLIIDQDTLINLSGTEESPGPEIKRVNLQKGTFPFTLIYNKHSPWVRGFSLEVEGPKMQKHSLTASNSLGSGEGELENELLVMVDGSAVTQRSFMMHNGSKRTHCISVGTPSGIHYAYDLYSGALLQAWEGEFLNTTPMWHSRGHEQLANPEGFTVSFHGDPELAILEDEDSDWPAEIAENEARKPLGYEMNSAGIPVFSFDINGSIITDKTEPSTSGRGVIRNISASGDQELWHKLAEGESIEKLADGSFVINDEGYFVEVSDESEHEAVIRESKGAYEL
ncbi:MAG: family 16 glycoside hydrolase, partial [Bacteroidota bacterium]